MTKLQKQEVNFTQVSNNVLCDKNLSAKAKWIYAYLYSKPNNWQFASERIARDFSDGLRAIKTGLQELEKAWYLKRKRQWDGSVDYFIYNNPQVENSTLDEDPKVENRTVLKPHSAKIDPISNTEYINNTEYISNIDNIACEKNFSSIDSEISVISTPNQELEAEKNVRKTSISSHARKTENEKRAKMLAFLKKTIGCDKFKDYNEWTEVGKMLKLGESIWQEQFLFRLRSILEDPFKAKNSNKLSYVRKEIEAFIHSPVIHKTEKYSVWQA